MRAMQRLPDEQLSHMAAGGLVQGVFQAMLFLPADEATCMLESLVELLSNSSSGRLHAYGLCALSLNKVCSQALVV